MNGASRAAPSPSAIANAQPSAASSVQAGSKPMDIPVMSRAQRTGSYASDTSSTLSPSLSSSFPSLRKTSTTWVKPSPTVNVHTTCGRHTDQYFFSGPSLSELARAVMRRKN